MASNNEYLNRLWSLHDSQSGAHNASSTAGFLSALQKDFTGKQQFFSAAEYRDPDLRDTILEDIARFGSGLYVVPEEVTRFAQELLGNGPVLSLYSGFGDVLLRFEAGLGIEPHTLDVEWSKFFAAIAGIDAEIINADPLLWNTADKFDRIVCTPPFGSRFRDIDLFPKLFSLLRERGQIVLIVPNGLLWRADRKVVRKLILENIRVSAVISLPSSVWAHTNIQTSVLVLKKSDHAKTYMANSKNPADLGAIAVDYLAWSAGREISLGFGVELDTERWDAGHYEPIDFELGELKFPYEVTSLGEIASIKSGKASPEAKIAVNRTGSKTVWIADEPHLNARNNIFITPSNRVNPSYLQLYLNSAIGRRALAKFIKGSTIPYVGAADLEHLPVVLPKIPMQNQIVDDALRLRMTVSALESLVAEGRQSLQEKIFNLAPVKQKFEKFAADTEKAFYQTLPFPIAVVYRKIANAQNNTQKFSLLIELFEVAIRFVVLVHLADYINGRRQAAMVAEHIPAIKKLFAPSLGDWVSMFSSFAHIKSAPDSKPFLQEIKNFKLDRYQRTLQEFVNIRNESLRGHGATLSEEEYELLFQEHAPKVYELISSLGFLSNYKLVKTGAMEKHGEFYKIGVQILMGDNPHFEHGSIEQRTPLDTDRVLYLNRDSESVVLDPYIVLEHCPECRRPELLLFDKFSDKKITYLGYESGHKPPLATADRLPALIREVANRRS